MAEGYSRIEIRNGRTRWRAYREHIGSLDLLDEDVESELPFAITITVASDQGGGNEQDRVDWIIGAMEWAIGKLRSEGRNVLTGKHQCWSKMPTYQLEQPRVLPPLRVVARRRPT